MRELDVLLTTWLEQRYEASVQADKEAFGRLLELSDPEIVSYLLGLQLPSDAQIAVLIKDIRSHTHD